MDTSGAAAVALGELGVHATKEASQLRDVIQQRDNEISK